jgi:DNA repair protein RadC
MEKSGGIIDHWLARLRGAQAEPAAYAVAEPPSRPRGFSEGAAYRPQALVEIGDTDAAALPFASIGPTGHRARMRDRLLTHGAGTLADYELLEMLLFFAFKKGDTKPLAKTLINRFGSFAGLLSAPQAALLAAQGLGPHAVTALKLVQEAAQRLARAEVMDKPVLNNWDRLMDYLTAMLAREKIEQFRILFLDPRNRLIADEAQARGTVNHTPVYPREVIKRALELHATAIILVHNHPSGDPTPSRGDIEMTAEIREAANILGVVLHDHVIIGNGNWLSFRREGLLE